MSIDATLEQILQQMEREEVQRELEVANAHIPSLTWAWDAQHAAERTTVRGYSIEEVAEYER